MSIIYIAALRMRRGTVFPGIGLSAKDPAAKRATGRGGRSFRPRRAGANRARTPLRPRCKARGLHIVAASTSPRQDPVFVGAGRVLPPDPVFVGAGHVLPPDPVLVGAGHVLPPEPVFVGAGFSLRSFPVPSARRSPTPRAEARADKETATTTGMPTFIFGGAGHVLPPDPVFVGAGHVLPPDPVFVGAGFSLRSFPVPSARRPPTPRAEARADKETATTTGMPTFIFGGAGHVLPPDPVFVGAGRVLPP